MKSSKMSSLAFQCSSRFASRFPSILSRAALAKQVDSGKNEAPSARSHKKFTLSLKMKRRKTRTSTKRSRWEKTRGVKKTLQLFAGNIYRKKTSENKISHHCFAPHQGPHAWISVSGWRKRQCKMVMISSNMASVLKEQRWDLVFPWKSPSVFSISRVFSHSCADRSCKRNHSSKGDGWANQKEQMRSGLNDEILYNIIHSGKSLAEKKPRK